MYGAGRQWLNITGVIFINFNVAMSACECLAWREVKPGQSRGTFIVVNKRARQSPHTITPPLIRLNEVSPFREFCSRP